MTPEFILQVLAMLGACAVTYGAIRADLARLHERTNQAVKTAELAHTRIDQILQSNHQ